MSYTSFCNCNFKSDGRRYDFFSFNYSSSLSTSEAREKTPLPDSFKCSSTPSEFSANPCVLFGNTLRALFLKNRDFFCYGEIFLPNTRGLVGCLVGFLPRRGGNYLPYVNWSCKLDEYSLPNLSNLMILLSIKDLVFSAMVNVADGGCWSLTCDNLSLTTETDVIVNVGPCLNRCI